MITYDKYTGVNCIRTYPNNYLEYIQPTIRFTDKDKNQAERALYSNYWREQIDMYGQKILYYRNLFLHHKCDLYIERLLKLSNWDIIINGI